MHNPTRNKYYYVPMSGTPTRFKHLQPFDVLGFKTFEPFERFLRGIKWGLLGGGQKVCWMGLALASVKGECERITNADFNAMPSGNLDPEGFWLHVSANHVAFMVDAQPDGGSPTFIREVHAVRRIVGAWGSETSVLINAMAMGD